MNIYVLKWKKKTDGVCSSQDLDGHDQVYSVQTTLMRSVGSIAGQVQHYIRDINLLKSRPGYRFSWLRIAWYFSQSVIKAEILHQNIYNCSCDCCIFILYRVFVVCIVLCNVLCLIVVLFCVMCVVCVLCLIVEQLPPGENPFAVKINYNNNKEHITLQILAHSSKTIFSLHRVLYNLCSWH
jgi:hypothetical protein